MKKYKIPTKKRDFFNWNEYKKAGLIVEGGLSIIVGGRDIGKTTGSIIDILRNYASATEMVFFGRNTLKEIESYAKSFNAQYGTEFLMTLNQIWKVEPETWENKKTKQQETRFKKKECIGFVGALSGTDGWRSANFNNVKYVFFDEYNQIGNSLDVQKFITLWTSILRTRKNVYTIIIGNRDDASAELNIELSIDISIPTDFKGDWIYEITTDPDFKDKMFYIDLDDTRFNNNNNKTAWKVLGNTTQVMGNYYKRGYKSYENIDCYKLKPDQMDLVKWEWAYHYGHYKLVKGTLNKLVVIHLDLNKEIDTETNYADIDLIHKNTEFIKPNAGLIYYQLTKAMKEQNIIYTSIAAKEDINFIVDQMINEIDDKLFKL